MKTKLIIVVLAAILFLAIFQFRQQTANLTQGLWQMFFNSTATSAQPSITVTSPNGGETFKDGDTMNIRWSVVGSFAKVFIHWETFDASDKLAYKGIVASGIPSASGSYSWKILPNFTSNKPNVSRMKIMISSTAGGLGTGAITDLSDNYFSISTATASEFRPSTVIYIDGGPEKPPGSRIPIGCNYDESRNKIAIIIKRNGYYDSPDMTTIFSQYFTAVKNHLNINRAGVKKFNGTTKEEFDVFIENLVKNDYVGYAIVVGMDLPVVIWQTSINPKTGETQIQLPYLLDLDAENYLYSFVGRGANNCKDIAMSFVFEPAIYSQTQKKQFVARVFANFINYHNNYSSTISRFNNKILYTIWDDIVLGGEGALNLGNPSDTLALYNNVKFFYPAEVVPNSSLSEMNRKVREKPLIWMYFVHGWPDVLGLSFKNPVPDNSTDLSQFDNIYTTNQDILDYSQTNGAPALFIAPDAACNQDVIWDGANSFCCWPQTWLKSGAWAFMDVIGEEGRNTFEKRLYEEKIVGKALKKTYHLQGMIYGDILAKLP